ncbi:hypothetical protein BSKO_13052 [Bryopsis sp. KO-2023]|nr:hypothetical protein BSKO_13052 [Bryopsis sp. KO-2023]
MLRIIRPHGFAAGVFTRPTVNSQEENTFGPVRLVVGGMMQNKAPGIRSTRAGAGRFRVELRSPITIEGNGASVQCPDDQRKGTFQIRSDDVTLSSLAFKGWFFNSLEDLIHVQSSKNITLKHVEFKGNQNVGKGPAGLSAAESDFRLLNVPKATLGLWEGLLLWIIQKQQFWILISLEM